MIIKLPYELTEGVTATESGLVFSPRKPSLLILLMGDNIYKSERELALRRTYEITILWKDAREYLLYTPNQPWAAPNYATGNIECGKTNRPPVWQLHRRAALLCDDAEDFRVLYECLMNQGEEND